MFISSILKRNDNLDEKGSKVNDYSLRYIDNSEVITSRHLNQSGLHLNRHGTKIFAENVIKVIKD